MILGFDLGKDRPVLMTEHLDKEDFGTSHGLANGLGLPSLDRLDVQDVIAQLILGDQRRVTAVVLMDQPHAAVIRMPGARSIGPQGESFGILSHGRPRMIVIKRILMLPLIRVTT